MRQNLHMKMFYLLHYYNNINADDNDDDDNDNDNDNLLLNNIYI